MYLGELENAIDWQSIKLPGWLGWRLRSCSVWCCGVLSKALHSPPVWAKSVVFFLFHFGHRLWPSGPLARWPHIHITSSSCPLARLLGESLAVDLPPLLKSRTSLSVPLSIWATPHLYPGAGPLQAQPVYCPLCSFWILVFIMLHFWKTFIFRNCLSGQT